MVTCVKMQGLLHIVYLVRAHGDGCRRVTHVKGSLRAPPSLASRTLSLRTNSRDRRHIAQLGAARTDNLTQHSVGSEDVVGRACHPSSWRVLTHKLVAATVEIADCRLALFPDSTQRLSDGDR